MKRSTLLSLTFLLLVIVFFYRSVFISGRVPIPTDTLVNLFHPLRDYYAQYYPRGVPYKNPLVGDPVLQQIPWRNLSLSEIAVGALPLWNPYQMAGYPLLGNIQSAPFYPLNLFFAFLPFITGWSVLIISQQVLAAFFMYLYLRNLKLSAVACVIGALSFAFSGFMIAWLEWGTIGHTALWVPLGLLAIDKLIEDRRTRWSVLLAASLVFSYFGGHLQTFIYGFSALVIYFVFRWWNDNRGKRLLLIVMSALVAALLVTLPVWLPQMRLIGLSARNVDQTWQKEGWFIPPLQVLQFFAPDFFGNPATGNYYGAFNYGEFIGFVGIAPLVLALLACLLHKKKDVLFWTGLAVLGLLFATHNPLAEIPYRLGIPFLSSTQPTRLMFVIDLALSILAAFGLNALQDEKQKLLRKTIFAILIPIFVSIGLILLVAQNISPVNVAVATRNLIVPAGLLTISAFLIVATTMVRQKRKVSILAGLCLITAADLLFFAGKYTPFASPDYFYPRTKLIEFLTKHAGSSRIMTTDRGILSPNLSTMYRLHSIDGYDPLYPLRFGELMAAVGRSKPDISSPFGFNRIVVPTNYESRVTDLLGVKYVLSLTDISNPRFKKVFEEGETKVYENSNVFPRAFFVEHVVSASDKQEVIERMFDNNLNLKTTAVVEEKLTQSTFVVGEVTIEFYIPNKVILKTENTGEGFLVLTDSYYPTWHATIDNQPASILQTDYNFRGVVVPKGSHTVEFNNQWL